MRVDRLINRLAEVAAFAAPLLVAIAMAQQISWHDQTQRASFRAEVALDRMGQITGQISSAFKSLHVYAPSQACSPAAVDFMRSVDMSSGLLQGVGYLARNALQCSSVGSVATHVGPPDFITASGTAFRRGRTLAEARRSPLLLISSPEGYTALVHPDLLFSFDKTDIGLPEGVVTNSTRDTVLAHGSRSFDWHTVALDPARAADTLVLDGHIVAWARSAQWDHLAYAGIPLAAQTEQFWRQLGLFAPFALVGGVACLLLRRAAAARRRQLPAQFRTALRRHEITAAYQPIVDMRTGEWIGAEVLARWQRPDGEFISPEVFIPIAEQGGLIRQLTAAMLRTALADCAQLVAISPGFYLSINVTSADLVAPDFVRSLLVACDAAGLTPAAIHLEVTERVEVKLDIELDTITALRRAGFSVGIDDFGVGYSNLAYLEKLPLDYLKIDRAFVAGLVQSEFGGQLIDHIIAIARNRRLEIVAEGIETPRQQKALLERGVRLGQGWLFARPMPVRELAERLAAAPPATQSAEPSDMPAAPRTLLKVVRS